MTRPAVDWEKIEVDFRAGVQTLRQIGDEYGVSHVAISRKAKKEGWPRDLSAKIAAKAKEKVTKASVTSEVTKQTERDVIEAESEIQSRILLGHRKDIPAKRELVAKLFAEIESLTDGKDVIEQMAQALASGELDRMADSVRKVTDLPMRIKGTSDLVSAYRALIQLERQAFSISDEPEREAGSLEEAIRRAATREVQRASDSL